MKYIIENDNSKERILNIIREIATMNIAHLDEVINRVGNKEQTLRDLVDLHKEGKVLLVRGREDSGTGHKGFWVPLATGWGNHRTEKMFSTTVQLLKDQQPEKNKVIEFVNNVTNEVFLEIQSIRRELEKSRRDKVKPYEISAVMSDSLIIEIIRERAFKYGYKSTIDAEVQISGNLITEDEIIEDRKSVV